MAPSRHNISLSLFTILMWPTIGETADMMGRYLCITEKASGFAYNEVQKLWDSRTMRAESKYIVSHSNNPEYAYQVTRFGVASPVGYCKDDFNSYGYLFCQLTGGELKFNKSNGRFIHVYALGYYNVLPDLNKITDENSDTPFIEIGSCAPF